MTHRAGQPARRLFRNMRFAQEHAEALAAQDQRGPEYIYATVDRAVLWSAIAFLQKMSGGPVSVPDNVPARVQALVHGELDGEKK